MAGSISHAEAIHAEGSAGFYISTEGSDSWSGTLAAPDAQGADGPFATLMRARDAVRDLKREKSADLVVLVRGGMYPLDKTVVFGLDVDPAAGDFSFRPGSPAFSLGTEELDVSKMGRLDKNTHVGYKGKPNDK